NNQGFVKEDFRAALAVVRVVESTLTAVVYGFLGLYSAASFELIPLIVPSILIGLPLGAMLIGRMNPETFRRVCMSFDAWVVGFGLSRALIETGILPSPNAYIALAIAATMDLWLLFRFFRRRVSDVPYRPGAALGGVTERVEPG
ncbi:MAG: sulfite exporter TauE/SafE family protein, partial [Chloroflexota bacterium]